MERLRVLDFQHSKLPLVPIGDRLFELSRKSWVVLKTNEGFIEVCLEKGFRTDGRSGPILVDFFIPHLGDQATVASWLTHDALGHDVGFSFDTTNDILDQMLELAGHSDMKSDVVEFFVGISDSWFGCVTSQEIANREKIRINWVHYSRLWEYRGPRRKPKRSVWKRIWRWVWG